MKLAWRSPLFLGTGGMALFFLLLLLNRTNPAIAKQAAEGPKDVYAAKMLLALTYMQQNGPPMPGIRLLVKLAQENPQRPEAPWQLGEMAMRTGQYAKAGGWYHKAFEAESNALNKAYALQAWGNALILDDKTDSARIILKEVFNYSNDSLLLRPVNEKLRSLE